MRLLRLLDNLEAIIFLSFNDLFRNYFPILNNLLVHQLSEYFHRKKLFYQLLLKAVKRG